MDPARRRLAGVCAGFALLSALPAAAQNDRPRRRPQPPPAPAPADIDDTPTRAGPRSPVPPTPASKPPALRSAIRSRWTPPARIIHSTTAPQCRAQCSTQRASCSQGASSADADASTCDPDWTRCLSACNGLSYSRGP